MKHSVNSSFGSYIKKLREENNYPQRKIAAYLDIDTSTLSKFENDQRIPNNELIIKIAEFFKIDKQELLSIFYSDKIANDLIGISEPNKVLKSAEAKLKSLQKSKSTIKK